MLPLFLFILCFSYITWLLMDTFVETAWWVMTCTGDLRRTGGFLDVMVIFAWIRWSEP